MGIQPFYRILQSTDLSLTRYWILKALGHLDELTFFRQVEIYFIPPCKWKV